MDETFTVGLNFDLPKNVSGTLSGIADSESFGPFPRIPKPQTNTSPSSSEIGFCQRFVTQALQRKDHSNKQFMFFNSCIAGSTIMHLNIKIH